METIPGMENGGWRKFSPFSPPGHLGPGENDDVEDLREDERRNREVNVAEPRREVDDEDCQDAGTDETVEIASQRFGGRTVRRCRGAVHPGPKNAEWPNDTIPV